MEKLIHGLHEFQRSIFRSHRDLFRSLAEGQSPETLFITCSDSRIDPNLLTQTKPGDMFIVRNAGNIVPPDSAGPPGGESATIEYAVAALGVHDIILCGHSHCGAMKAVLAPGDLEQLPRVAAWLEHARTTRRIVEESYAHLSGNARLTAAVEENVLVQLEQLRTHPSVAAGLAAGTVRLHGWVYEIETGEVFGYDPELDDFVPVTKAPSPSGGARPADMGAL